MRAPAHKALVRTAALAALLLAPFALLHAPAAHAQDGPWPVLNDYGGVGLWQTPTARFMSEGSFAGGISTVYPYNRLYFTHQLLPWMEATLRYTEISNRLYSEDPEFSGDQTFKDRSFDVRLRLLRESDWKPAVALGFRDVGGTRQFRSEYLVASRRWYDFDFSLGLAWGRLAADGSFANPLGEGLVISDPTDRGFQLSDLFSGERMGVFGGVQWRTPFDGLQLSLEYEENDYQSEPLENRLEQDFPVNFGAAWKLPSGFEFSLGLERGNTVVGRIVGYADFERYTGPPKYLDPAVPRLRVPPLAETPERAAYAERVRAGLKRNNIDLYALSYSMSGSRIEAWISPGDFRNPAKTSGRAAIVLLAEGSAQMEAADIHVQSAGLETYRVRITREDIAAAEHDADVLARIGESAVTGGGRRARPTMDDLYPLPDLSWSAGPGLRQHVGGPDEFYFGQLFLRLGADLQLTRTFSLNGAVGFNIYNNFDGLELESDSVLPHVRSDIVKYLKEGEHGLIRLEGNYVFQLGPDWYGRLSAGIFEEMFGGVAGEILYRPDRWFAAGINVNRVRQRDFDMRFGFRDYEVTTGHLSTYFELPKNVTLRLSGGRYLAGDTGGTIDLSRRFRSGIRVGAFATFTDVSSEEFGEGAFDKGFYLYIPFDVLLPKSSRTGGTLMFRPLTRDGGQKVRDGRGLYDITADIESVRDERNWEQLFE